MGFTPRERPGLWAGLVSVIVYLILGFLLLVRQGPAPTPWLRLPLSIATAASNALTFGLLAAGWVAIRSGRPTRHRLLMELALVSISGFLILYVTRQYLVGRLPFEGPEMLRVFVYLPLLIPHLAISAACVPPVIYNFIVGLTREMGKVGMTLHPLVGRVVVPLWLLSSAQGLTIFALLQYYHAG